MMGNKFKVLALAASAVGFMLLAVQCKTVDKTISSAGHQISADKSKPNIIVILADDLGKYDLSLYGGLNVPTPNIDSIGINGVTFDYGYCTAPICAPSRAALITGQYQQRFSFEFLPHHNYPNRPIEMAFFNAVMKKGDSWGGAQPNDNAPNRRECHTLGLTTQVPTLAEVLKDEGYATGIFGKWHLGVGDSAIPTNRGFDEQYGFYEAFALYSERKDNTIVSYKHKDSFADKHMWCKGDKGQSRIRRNGELIKEDEYLTFAIARETNKFIRENKDKPFFAYVPFSAPHEPFQVPKSYYDKLPQIRDENKRVYYAMIMALDDAVGMIMQELKKQGLDENTLIVFSSDNGAATYTHACTNYPLKGGKFMNFEGGINVPYMMQWKGVIDPKTTYANPVSLLDVFATSCYAAGVNTDSLTLDGVNLVPYVNGLKATKPHDELFWRSGYNYAARINNWKVIIDDEHKIVELYNLDDDRGEECNLSAEDHTAVIKELEDQIKLWDKNMKQPAWPWIMNYKVVINGKTYFFAV